MKKLVKNVYTGASYFMKKIILIICMLTVSQRITAENHASCYTPENTILAFDIDQVILNCSEHLPSILWKHKYALARIFGDITFTKTIYTLWRSGAPVADYIEICTKKNHPDLLAFITDLINARTPIYGTVVILNELKKLGYTLYIATNESPITYELHKKRLPEIFNLFAGVKLVSPDEHAQGIKKPYKAYFDKLLEQLAPEKKEFIFFIDDRIDNIEGAEKSGLIGIQFTSPEQLRRELEHLHILPKSAAQTEPLISQTARA